jgi:hypothetical protein
MSLRKSLSYLHGIIMKEGRQRDLISIKSVGPKNLATGPEADVECTAECRR